MKCLAFYLSLWHKLVNKMKIWQKNIDVDSFVESFTVGNDRAMDLHLAAADVLGSLAHTQMLNSIHLMKISMLYRKN